MKDPTFFSGSLVARTYDVSNEENFDSTDFTSSQLRLLVSSTTKTCRPTGRVVSDDDCGAVGTGQIYTDGSKGETNTTGSGVLIELPGRVIKFQRRNADHAFVFRTKLIAIMCSLSFINIIRDLAFSEIWILTDSRSSIQHLSNWPSIGDSTSRSILHFFQQLSDQHPIHLQWVPSHVGLLGNEVADALRRWLPAILWIRKTTWFLHRLRSTPGLRN
ncbi:RNase H domain-containing protein [Trichonephila clavipes]|nr:RNase H domain-containing protein [Trichonephila clavipes]